MQRLPRKRGKPLVGYVAFARDFQAFGYEGFRREAGEAAPKGGEEKGMDRIGDRCQVTVTHLENWHGLRFERQALAREGA